MKRRGVKIVLAGFLGALIFTGCAATEARSLEVTQQQDAAIRALHLEIKRLNEELDRLVKGREALLKIQSLLNAEMNQEIEDNELSITLAPRGLVISLPDRTLFESGGASLKPSARTRLARIAQILKSAAGNRKIYIEGHTDSDPIRLSRWRSNWELSTARALEVLHYFSDEAGLDSRQLAATGYGEYQPVSELSSPEDKAKNRRVEVLIQ